MKNGLIAVQSVVFVILVINMCSPVCAYGVPGSYQTLLGDLIQYSSFQGTFLFVDAMATDCKYCINQHPVLNELHDLMGEKISMLTLAVRSWDNIETVTEFINKYPNPWGVGIDPNQAFANRYGIEGTPTMLLFNIDGELVHRWVGETPLSELVGVINSYLEGKSTAVIQNNQGSTGKTSDRSFIGDIFANPVFKLITGITVALLVYFQLTKKPPVDSS